RFLRRFRDARVRQWVFEARRNQRIGVDAESGYAGKRSRASGLAVENGVAIGHGRLSRRSPVNGGRNPVVEHGLAKIPAVGVLRIEEPGQNVFAVRLDDPGIRGISDLIFARYVRDLISLDHDYRISDGCASVAIDQRAAFDHQRRGLLRACGREAVRDRQQEKKRQAAPRAKVRFPHFVLQWPDCTTISGLWGQMHARMRTGTLVSWVLTPYLRMG